METNNKNYNKQEKLYQVQPPLPKSEIIYSEEWKALNLEGYSDYFLISNYGRIYNKQLRKLQPLRPDRANYLITDLRVNGENRKTVRVHRYVLRTFKPIDNDLRLQTNHKDGDKSNNKLDNLEWLTAEQNRSHAVSLGLYRNTRRFTDDEVIFIRESKKSNIKLAKEFNTESRTIANIKRGLSYRKVQETG